MTHEEFKIAAFLANECVNEMPDWCDSPVSDIVETYEPADNFRPVDVMTGKRAGEEIQTRYGLVVIRKGIQRAKGEPRQKMFIGQGENGATLIGWELP